MTTSVCTRSFESTSSLPTGWDIDGGSRSSVLHMDPRSKVKYIGIQGNARTHSVVAVAVDIEYAYGALVVHALLGHAHDLLIVVGEGDALHHSREFPHEKALARLHGTEPHLIVRGSGNREARLCCM